MQKLLYLNRRFLCLTLLIIFIIIPTKKNFKKEGFNTTENTNYFYNYFVK